MPSYATMLLCSKLCQQNPPRPSKGFVRQLDTRFGDYGEVDVQDNKDKSDPNMDFSKMDSLAQLTLQRELEQVIEKERRKQAKASERHKKRVSFVMKNGSRE